MQAFDRVTARGIAALGAVLLLAACATQPAVFPASVLPGKGKDAAAFQLDDTVCRQHAVAHTGYTPALQPNEPASPGANDVKSVPGEPPAASIPTGLAPDAGSPNADGGDEVGYLQCMAARGDTVQVLPYYAAAPGYAYGPPYGYGYPLGIDDFYATLGFGWGHGGWYNGGWYRGPRGRFYAGAPGSAGHFAGGHLGAGAGGGDRGGAGRGGGGHR